MSITIRNGGLLTTVQDLGRVGYQQYGVPASGVMDRRSCRIANMLAGNDDSAAVLEATLVGPALEFGEDCFIAVTGGNMSPSLNGVPLPMYRAVEVKRGDVLSFGRNISGCRAYIAVSGGFNTEPVMGSRSTYLKGHLGGYKGRKLEKGDSIEIGAHVHVSLSGRATVQETFNESPIVLRVVRGPQDDCFTDEGIHTFFSAEYVLTPEFDRMGCRLQGEIIEHNGGADIISDGIAFGAVQVPSHGNPIIMMADRQTTGGYTKIANVITVDLPKIAQAKAGDKVVFREVSVEEAQRLYVAEENFLAGLRRSLDSSLRGALRSYVIRINGKSYDVTVERED